MTSAARQFLVFNLALGGTYLAYFVTARMGLSLYTVSDVAALVWPPAGIAIAAAYLGGYRFLPAIGAGALTAYLSHGVPALAGAVMAAGNTLEALVAATVLKSPKFSRLFRNLNSTIDYIAYVAIGTTAISALTGAFALLLHTHLTPAAFVRTAVMWWAGGALSALVVAPCILAWRNMRIPRTLNAARAAELSWFASTLLVANLMVFWSPFTSLKEYPLLYLILFPLVWAILRLGPRPATAAIAVTAANATIATFAGFGPFSGMPMHNSLILLMLFSGVTSVTFLVFLSIIEEHKRAVSALAGYVTQLEKAIEKIRTADRAKNDFLAILSHELRNPIAPVMSALELMRLRGPAIANFGAVVDSAYENIQRVARLLDDLLDITRISQQTFSLKKEIIDLRPVFDAAIKLASPAIQGRRHTLTVEYPSERVWLDADPLRLEQILVNLLNNAAKYTDPGGRIHLSCVPEERVVTIAVADTGIGIPADLQEKIFEPFEQLGRTPGNTGLGIGLSLTKKLVELHGGTIGVQSDGPGSGSTFTVRFPRPQLAMLPIPFAEVGTEPSSRDGGIERKGFRILVADDNPAADSLAHVLGRLGHATRTAYSGAETLESAASFAPDVIFMGMNLPDMNGYELAQRIRTILGSRTLLVAVSEHGSGGDVAPAHDTVFDYHFAKPVPVAGVERVLSELHRSVPKNEVAAAPPGSILQP